MPLNGEPHGEVSGTEVLKGVPVLVVEDTWHVAKLMSTILEQLDMDVIGPTASAAEARWLVANRGRRLRSWTSTSNRIWRAT